MLIIFITIVVTPLISLVFLLRTHYIASKLKEGNFLTEKQRKKLHEQFLIKIGEKEEKPYKKTFVYKNMKTIIYILTLLIKFIAIIITLCLYVVISVGLAILITKLYLWYVIIPVGIYYAIKKSIKKWKHFAHKRRELKLQPMLTN
jgi:hypothetical protein